MNKKVALGLTAIILGIGAILAIIVFINQPKKSLSDLNKIPTIQAVSFDSEDFKIFIPEDMEISNSETRLLIGKNSEINIEIAKIDNTTIEELTDSAKFQINNTQDIIDAFQLQQSNAPEERRVEVDSRIMKFSENEYAVFYYEKSEIDKLEANFLSENGSFVYIIQFTGEDLDFSSDMFANVLSNFEINKSEFEEKIDTVMTEDGLVNPEITIVDLSTNSIILSTEKILEKEEQYANLLLPIAYQDLFENDIIQPNSVVTDEPFEDILLKNQDGSYNGEITAQKALERGRIIPPARLIIDNDLQDEIYGKSILELEEVRTIDLIEEYINLSKSDSVSKYFVNKILETEIITSTTPGFNSS